MSVTIVKAGICDTVQDAGRYGFASDGINPTGVMDLLAMRTANLLAGNPLSTAVVEFHFPASSCRFDADAIIALSGADFGAEIISPAGKKTSFSANKTTIVKSGSILSFTKKVTGERCYLAVNKGFDLPQWLGSWSTNLKIKQGGFNGRRLLQNDEIFLNKSEAIEWPENKVFPWMANIRSWYQGNVINVLKGPEWDLLQPVSKKAFLSKPFTILPQSDRMGIKLQGPVLQRIHTDELVSSGVNFGTIQLPSNGQPIVLMADRAITGGYPRIAHVISAHLPMLAEVSPNSPVLFAFTDIAKAEELLLLQQKEITQMQAAVKLKFIEFGII